MGYATYWLLQQFRATEAGILKNSTYGVAYAKRFPSSRVVLACSQT
jgi:hypothetical protein